MALAAPGLGQTGRRVRRANCEKEGVEKAQGGHKGEEFPQVQVKEARDRYSGSVGCAIAQGSFQHQMSKCCNAWCIKIAPREEVGTSRDEQHEKESVPPRRGKFRTRCTLAYTVPFKCSYRYEEDQPKLQSNADTHAATSSGAVPLESIKAGRETTRRDRSLYRPETVRRPNGRRRKGKRD
jgi:hypothetical protein